MEEERRGHSQKGGSDCRRTREKFENGVVERKRPSRDEKGESEDPISVLASKRKKGKGRDL